MLKEYRLANGTTKKVHLLGWKKQPTDHRDEAYRLKLHGSFFSVPSTLDLRSICSAIEDQGPLGSCTANALAGCVEANEIRQGAKLSKPALVTAQAALMPAARGLKAALPTVNVTNVGVNASGVISYTTTITPAAGPTPGPTPTPTPTPSPTPTPTKLIQVSRLFEYYATRKLEGSTSEDSGATIRDTIKAAYTYGIADESAWPYDVNKFAVNPPQSVWTAAASHKVTSYHAITDGDLQTMKSVLAQQYLIEFGFSVYDYFMSADMAAKALLGVPKSGESFQGGHAVCLCGYDDNKPMPDNTKGAFLVRNSWGADWGLGGYFWMSYAYVGNTRLASDFWVVQSSPV